MIFEHGTPRTADFPSLYQIWRKNVDRDAKIMAQNRNPPSWICYVIISDHPQSPFIGPHRPVKFYANPMYSFEDMTI